MDLLAFNNTAKLDEVWKTDVQYQFTLNILLKLTVYSQINVFKRY